MGMIVLALMLWTFHRTLQDFCLKHRLIIIGITLLYIAGIFWHTQFLIGKGWVYGIPGADMAAHFHAATDLAQGVLWEKLKISGSMRFQSVQLNTIGYFAYAQYLSWLLYSPTIINIQVSLYIVYLSQALMSVCAAINFSRTYFLLIRGTKKITPCVIILSCIPFAILSYQLMRDIYLMWGLSIIYRETMLLQQGMQHKTAGVPSVLKNAPKGLNLRFASSSPQVRWTKIFLLTLLCCLLRFYSLLLILPFVLGYGVSKKRGAICSLFVTGILLLGSSFISFFHTALKISWQFGTIDPYETLQYLIFPSIINQTKYLLNWDALFGKYDYISGCNLPGVYYLMSVWNVAFFPSMIVGIFRTAKTKTAECVLWLSMLLNMCMLYSLVYTSIDTRQKLMIALPICYFSLEGFQWLRKKGAIIMVLYVFTILFILWGCFAIA